MTVVKRRWKWFALGGGIVVLALAGLLWPTSVAKEPAPSLIAGLAPHSQRTTFSMDDSYKIQMQSYRPNVTFAEALKQIESEANSIGLTRLGSSMTWSCDFGCTDGFMLHVDTYPSRKIGTSPDATAPAMIWTTRRTLNSTMSHVQDGYYRMEKRIKVALGVWP